MATRKNCTTGHTGVVWDKKMGCYKSQLHRNKICYFLGYHIKMEDAIAARQAFVEKLKLKEKNIIILDHEPDELAECRRLSKVRSKSSG